MTQERTAQWARTRKAVDALVLLPDGRVGSFSFRGENRSLEWLQHQLLQRYTSQFFGEAPRLMILCACQKHWSQLPVGTQLQQGKDLTIMALPASYDRVQGLVPELAHRLGPRAKPMPLRTSASSATSIQIKAPPPLPMLRPKSACEPKAPLQTRITAPPTTPRGSAGKGKKKGKAAPVPVAPTNVPLADEEETPYLETVETKHVEDKPDPETPFQRAWRIPGGYMVVYWEDKMVRFDVVPLCTGGMLVNTLSRRVLHGP